MTETMKKHISLTIVFLVSFIVCGFSQSNFYPIIPDSIKDREARISYMTIHFWDNSNFSDSSLLTQPKLFLDYIYLLLSLPDEERMECLPKSVWPISSQPFGFDCLMFWLDRYLHNPQSPYYNDRFFLQFVDILLETATDEGQLNELSYFKEMTQRNQIGGIAEDFSFVTKEGTKNRLYNLDAPLLLLVFNSPNCSLCQKLEKAISGNHSVQELIDNRQLKVLAISPIADYEDFINHEYPINWICGYDKEKNIVKETLYEIRQFPSIYLLDRDKRVIIKEADYDMLKAALFK